MGALYLPQGAEPNRIVSSRFLPALASVLAIAVDRERLAHEALETEALRRSDALKTSLIRAVSHDLRSPLTAIRAALEALESPALTLDQSHRAALVHSALVESERLDRMVRNLLDLSRLEAGAAPPAARVRTVESLLDQALAQLPPGERRVDLRLPAQLPLVQVDPAQLERVLVNLLENALKYSPPGSRVDIEVEPGDDGGPAADRRSGTGARACRAGACLRALPARPGRPGQRRGGPRARDRARLRRGERWPPVGGGGP